MTQLMKIIIGYDGSECADNAVDDLLNAGLPAKAEALVVSVAEQLMPIPASYGMVETDFTDNIIGGSGGALSHVKRGAEKIQAKFPEWVVTTDVGFGSPASFILKKAEEWKPDLIVVGSHGRSALGRMIIGSVSQKLVHNATASVRVARPRAERQGSGVRLIVGIDGSPDSEEAAREIILRQWPEGSEVRLINASWAYSPALSNTTLQPISQWLADEKSRIGSIIGNAENKMKDAGLKTEMVIKEGEAKQVLLEEAENWKADCIFVGASGMGKVERLMLGSVSSAIAARADCSVEVVRRA